jgi:hypothetical protein
VEDQMKVDVWYTARSAIPAASCTVEMRGGTLRVRAVPSPAIWKSESSLSGRTIRPTTRPTTAAVNAADAGTTTRSIPDPARKAWTCRRCHSAYWVYAPPGRQIWTNLERRRYRRGLWAWFWVFAVAGWPLVGIFVHSVAYNGSDVTAYMSNAERWAASLSVALVLSLFIGVIAGLFTSGHAGKVERRHGWGPSVTWPYPETTPTR